MVVCDSALSIDISTANDKESIPTPPDKRNIESFRESLDIYKVGCTRSL